MSSTEDREFVVRYLIDKNIEKARNKGIEICCIDTAYKRLEKHMENIGKELSKGRTDENLSNIQQELIKVATLSIMLSIDACQM